MLSMNLALKRFRQILLAILFLLGVVWIQAEVSQWFLRWRAEHLLTDVRSLDLNRSGWSDALGGRTSPGAAGFRLRQARALGTDGLRQAFDHLARADLDLKGERAIPGDVVLEILVARLANLSARSGARAR